MTPAASPDRRDTTPVLTRQVIKSTLKSESESTARAYWPIIDTLNRTTFHRQLLVRHSTGPGPRWVREHSWHGTGARNGAAACTPHRRTTPGAGPPGALPSYGTKRPRLRSSVQSPRSSWQNKLEIRVGYKSIPDDLQLADSDNVPQAVVSTAYTPVPGPDGCGSIPGTGPAPETEQPPA